MKIKQSRQMDSEMERLLLEQQLDTRVRSYISNTVEAQDIYVEDLKNISDPHKAADEITQAIEVIGNSMGAFKNEEERRLVLPTVAKTAQLLDVQEFRQNPYLQNVSLMNVNQGKFSITYGVYDRYQLLCCDTPLWVQHHYFAVPAVGCFNDDFVFPCFLEGNAAWMSITPNEIITMRQPVQEAKGKVLTLGCGMGYYTYMAACKDNVESVTIVEYAPDVIELFKQYILPQFPDPSKVTIVQDDAYEYMQHLEDGTFDYCFADTWIGADSVPEYLAMREACRHLKKTKVSYWIESAFLNSLFKLTALEALNSYSAEYARYALGFTVNEQAAQAREYVSELLEDTIITSPNALTRLFDRNNFKALMTRSAAQFSR